MWQKGQSGNPRGKKPGTLSRSTYLRRRYGDRLLKKLAHLTFRKRPDPVAMRILADKTIASARAVARPIRLPRANPRDLAQFGRVVLRRMAQGRLSPDVARDVLSALAAQAQLTEHAEIITRLEELETRYQQSQTLFNGTAGVPVSSRSGGRTHVQ